MNMIQKTGIATIALAGIALASLGLGASDASAGGWKKFKRFHHFHAGYHYNHYNYCTPKFRKMWVWSPRRGRKILRTVRVGKWCGGRYYRFR